MGPFQLSPTATNNILDFNTDLLAQAGGIVTGQLYRTGGILKIKVDEFGNSIHSKKTKDKGHAASNRYLCSWFKFFFQL